MRTVAQLVGTLLLVGFVLKYWWLIARVVAAIAACKYAPEMWASHQAAVAGNGAGSLRLRRAPTTARMGASR